MLHGTAHQTLFSGPKESLQQRRLIDPGTGERQRPTIKCFWGSFTVDGDLVAKVLQSLPEIIVLKGLADAPIEWDDVVCDLVLRELGSTRPGASLMVSLLLDLLLVIILRRWAQSGDSLPDLFAAAKDESSARGLGHPCRSGTRPQQQRSGQFGGHVRVQFCRSLQAGYGPTARDLSAGLEAGSSCRSAFAFKHAHRDHYRPGWVGVKGSVQLSVSSEIRCNTLVMARRSAKVTSGDEAFA